MRALFLTRLYPYPTRSGGLAYTAGVISALADRVERLDVLCNAEAGTVLSPEPRNNVSWYLVPAPRFSRLKAAASSQPGECVRYASPLYLDRIGSLAGTGYEVIFLDHFGTGFALDAALRVGCPVVYVSHNFETQVRRDVARFSSRSPMKVAYGLLDAAKVGPMEARLVRESALVTAISETDRDSFDGILPGKSLLISPAPSTVPEQARSIDTSTPRHVLLYGSMEWQAKSESLIRFLEKAAGPFRAAGIRLDVVGRATPLAQRRMADHGDWLTYHGFVGDVRPIRLQSRIGLMVDQVGGGFKTKLVDYFLWRVPVAGIASQMNGLPDFADGRDWFAEDTIDAVIERVVSNIDNLPLLNAMQASAFTKAAKLFSLEARSNQIGNLLHRVSATAA